MHTSIRHQHGGQLSLASQIYNIPLADWIDLSTGINPQSYPLPEMPTNCWRRLPEINDGLEITAKEYYGSSSLLPVAGSQEAIQRLPSLFEKKRNIGIITPAYHSHQQAWEKAGHRVIPLSSSEVEDKLSMLDVLLVVSPTNPSAEIFSTKTLLGWHQQLAQRGGTLIIDEAFIDATPEKSLITKRPKVGLIVLRSIGKFFGLAGIRLGFVWAVPEVLKMLSEKQDDWAVSHPARWAGKMALRDSRWQEEQRKLLIAQTTRLKVLINKAICAKPFKSGGVSDPAQQRCFLDHTALFVYIKCSRAEEIHIKLAKQGILTRYFDQPSALRFGLPSTGAQWRRLEQALEISHD